MFDAVKDKGLSYLIVGPFAIVLAFPFYVMVITAFKNQSEFYDPSVNPYWFGKNGPTLDNASFLFHHTAYPTWLANTAIVGVCVVAITRRQRPPSSSPRLPALAADEWGLRLAARDPEFHQHHWEGH